MGNILVIEECFLFIGDSHLLRSPLGFGSSPVHLFLRMSEFLFPKVETAYIICSLSLVSSSSQGSLAIQFSASGALLISPGTQISLIPWRIFYHCLLEARSELLTLAIDRGSCCQVLSMMLSVNEQSFGLLPFLVWGIWKLFGFAQSAAERLAHLFSRE